MKQLYDKISKKCQKRDLSSAFQNIESLEVNINSGTHMHLPLKPAQQAVQSQSMLSVLSISEYRQTNKKGMSRELTLDHSPPHKPFTKMIQAYLWSLPQPDIDNPI
ncbi:TPA: hypothetical protein ACV7V9_004232 [Escherichia coli]|uniref:hypothetical protein n=1 Tax=Escherichia coli TaxID=562 RepID=UPI001CC3B384|nr:hypothetical protein [Escherichia coli]MCV3079702.1 hypothetical protein [Escherichia coli]